MSRPSMLMPSSIVRPSISRGFQASNLTETTAMRLPSTLDVLGAPVIFPFGLFPQKVWSTSHLRLSPWHSRSSLEASRFGSKTGMAVTSGAIALSPGRGKYPTCDSAFNSRPNSVPPITLISRCVIGRDSLKMSVDDPSTVLWSQSKTSILVTAPVLDFSHKPQAYSLHSAFLHFKMRAPSGTSMRQ